MYLMVHEVKHSVWCMGQIGNRVDVTSFLDSDYAKDPDKGREFLEAKSVEVVKVRSGRNVVDALTKVVPGSKFEYSLDLLSIEVWCMGQIGNRVDVTSFLDSDYAKDPDKGREFLEAKSVEVVKVRSGRNVVDALTKVVPGSKFEYSLDLLSIEGGRNCNSNYITMTVWFAL
uniref:Uncharacterized protein n=1 Tax=Tanacetum cinerariifolium TaxID=118510 RepID=A0A699JUY0_TANCI|nr:hypothetical protein [Tanacetum cinerariifolium]